MYISFLQYRVLAAGGRATSRPTKRYPQYRGVPFGGDNGQNHKTGSLETRPLVKTQRNSQSLRTDYALSGGHSLVSLAVIARCPSFAIDVVHRGDPTVACDLRAESKKPERPLGQ